MSPVAQTLSYVTEEGGVLPVPGLQYTLLGDLGFNQGVAPLGNTNDTLNALTGPGQPQTVRLGPDRKLYAVYEGRIGRDLGVAVAKTASVPLTNSFDLNTVLDRVVSTGTAISIPITRQGVIGYWDVGRITLSLYGNLFADANPTDGCSNLSNGYSSELIFELNGTEVARFSSFGPNGEIFFLSFSAPVPPGARAEDAYTLTVRVEDPPPGGWCPDTRIVLDTASVDLGTH